MIEGLSRIIQDAKAKGMLKGIKLCKNLSITHFLFAYDVLMFNLDSLDEWRCYKEIINLLCKASGITVRNKKLSFFHSKMDLTTLTDITSILPFKTCDLESGFHYLAIF